MGCKRDEECPLGRECADGLCADVEFWKRFRSHDLAIPCPPESGEDFCPRGSSCVEGLCRRPCAEDSGCSEGESCAAVAGCKGPGCARACRARSS